MKFRIGIISFFLLTFIFSTQAQTVTPKVAQRQVSQQKRIKQGVAQGDLTKREATKLQAQQAHIHRTKKRAKADGVVTKKERARIHKKQNRASKQIYRQKKDRQVRKSTNY
ncbi:MAG: hypothetical protein AAFP19_15850 [Bacteroidota bacterium]